MSTITLEIAEETRQHAEQSAAAEGTTAPAVLLAWLAQGRAESAVNQLLATINPALAQEQLSSQELEQLARGLNEPAETLKQAESIELEELLRMYRQCLVGKAQAITDWLTVNRARDTRRQVTNLTTVTSTMLYAVGYDAATQTLDVIFNTGGIYRYLHVPPTIYRDLLSAESVGQYMWRNVLRLYPFVRLGK